MKFAVLVLGSLGIAQALLVCIYLLTVKEKKTNILLAIALFGLTMRIGKSLVLSYVPLDPWIRNLGISGTLLTGPFLWFYGKALFEKRDFGNNDYLHLIPFALFVLLCPIIPNRGDFVSYLTYTLVLFHFALYLSGCWMYIARHLQGARLLSWYRNIIIGASSIGLLFLGIFLRIIPFYILGAVFFSFLIYIFSFLLLRRHVFTLEKYSNSGIDTATSKRWLQLIKELFETKEIYLDSRISLKAVAESLSITPRQVSQVINEHEQKNFSEFVNQYRIGKAKVLLADRANANEKIETIAFDCGFGNVTSFNLSFKAETGMTPSQYKSQFFPA